jgi:hypothetical protein
MQSSYLGLASGLLYFYIWGFPHGLKKPPRLHPYFKILPNLLHVENGMIFFYFKNNRYHLHHWFISLLVIILSLPFSFYSSTVNFLMNFFIIGFIHGLQVYIDRFEFLENH